MKLQSLYCPSCGAQIQVDEEKEFGFCMYCGAQIRVKEVVHVKHEGEVKLKGVRDTDDYIKDAEQLLRFKNYESLKDYTDTKIKEYPREPSFYYYWLKAAIPLWRQEPYPDGLYLDDEDEWKFMLYDGIQSHYSNFAALVSADDKRLAEIKAEMEEIRASTFEHYREMAEEKIADPEKYQDPNTVSALKKILKHYSSTSEEKKLSAKYANILDEQKKTREKLQELRGSKTRFQHGRERIRPGRIIAAVIFILIFLLALADIILDLLAQNADNGGASGSGVFRILLLIAMPVAAFVTAGIPLLKNRKTAGEVRKIDREIERTVKDYQKLLSD